ncbi:hypothetical protein, variant 1 [Verruconis gallopava]|nr:hypothetical protein, variant 1 [Verruconis gallopava]KIV99403.1 hypothetical protein, variant 1 [Verruconis gallopava]
MGDHTDGRTVHKLRGISGEVRSRHGTSCSHGHDVLSLYKITTLADTQARHANRRDFYWQKDFTCEITGHSNLTFFDAYESETASLRQLDIQFPEPLREPILKKAQFTTFGRLEYLVNWIYEAFKHDFFPREHVIAILDNGEKAEGIVREKVSFPDRYMNGVLQPATSRYLVSVEADPSSKREAMDVPVEGANIYRDRRNFSKLLLRSFLKGALQKESWHGAPWLVKMHLAQEYNIPTEIPPHLHQRAVMAERKNLLAMQKRAEPIDQTTFFNYLASKQRPLEVRPPPGGKGGKNHRFIQQDIGKYVHKNGDPALVQYQVTPGGTPVPILLPDQGNPPPAGQPLAAGMAKSTGGPGATNAQYPVTANAQYTTKAEVVPTPPPPQIKFPCEDTEVPPRKDVPPRPSLKFFSEDLPSGELVADPVNPGLKISSVGTLLEIWDTLNVHSEVFVLDSFTVDDFAEAMRFSSPDVDCELLNEVHCAVLKQLVDEQGDVQVSLPEFDPSDSEDDEEEEEEEEEPSAEPSPEPQFRRTTRSSLRKEEAAALKQRTPTPEPKEVHQAAAMQGERPWKDRLKERDFKDGGWQVILVGVLHQVSLMPRKKEICDKILSILAPIDKDPTDETAKSQYFTALDVNLRLEALQIITQLATSTPALRKHLEDMSAEMTELRKKKIEQQRLKKDIIDELHKLDEQRKELASQIQAKKPEGEANGQADVEISDIPSATNGIADSREGSEDEAPPVQLRRGADRKRKREEEAARREKAKKEKAAQPKRTREEIKLDKLVEEIETKKADILDCEEKIAEYTNDLRETDCQRSKCLGRDRFCNRYWWFERNGMPFGGVPHTSTAHYNYASGRIWVQGPDQIDREGLLDLDKDLQASYLQVFDITILDRKQKEEGDTHLETADHWGYIDEPEKIDQLLGWLDERGLREKALRKELLAWREIIVDCMKKMREHLDEVAAKKLNSKQDEESMPTRISTRTKAHAADVDRNEWPCLQWHNTLAVEAFGILHSEGIRKRRRGVAKKVEKASKKDTKLVTRTGASYGRK